LERRGFVAKKNGDVYLGRLDIASFLFEGHTHYLQRIINIDNQRIFSENLFREVKKFEALFHYATLPILLVNKEGKIILANSKSLKLFDYTELQITALFVEQLIPQKFRDNHSRHRADYEKNPLTRPMGVGMELYALKKSGEEFPVEVSLGHYQIEQEQFVICFIIDITQRKKIEDTMKSQTSEMERAKKEIEELNAELENKVELRTQELTEALTNLEKSRDDLTMALSKERELSDLKSRFVSMASHEFRTPLSTILSSVSLIAKYTSSSDQDKRDKHIQRIHSAVSNLTDILNEFLSLGKIEEDLIPFLLNELNSQRPYIKKNYSLLIKKSTEISIQERVYKVFPSLTSFRYLPVLDAKFRIEDDIKQKMISFCSINAIDNQKVFLFYCRYPSVIQLDLFSAINHIDIMRPDNILSEDICVVPLDFSWIALLSLEDEFYFLHIDSSNES